MKSNRKYSATELNDYDRKIIDKYAGNFTNFIESNTAKTKLEFYSNEGHENNKDK